MFLHMCYYSSCSLRGHLEVICNLTETTFLQAFRRFNSRKSLLKIMVSDNGTTFHAAANTICLLMKSSSVQDTLHNQGKAWQFIPKRAPWFGGWWERLIGLTKTILTKFLGRPLYPSNNS